MNKTRSRGNSVQTVVDFLQLETIGRDRLGELMVNDCTDWFDSEKKSRIDIIKKFGLDKRSAILLSAYSFKEYASDFEKFKEKFKNTTSSSLQVLNTTLLDYHMEKDKIYHRHALELLLFNPDLSSFSHHHMKIPTLFLIQILSTGKYKGELIATTVEKWQLFLFVQALVVFVKLYVINTYSTNDDESDIAISMVFFTVFSLLGGTLIILVLLMILQKITGYDIDENDLKNNDKQTQKRNQWNNCNVEARFWVDRRYIFGEYLITGLALLMCSLWLTAVVMMSQLLPNNSSFSISAGLTYIIAIIILYSSKILLSFEPFSTQSWFGFIYYGTCRITNSLSKLLTSFIEWITFLFLMIVPYMLIFLFCTFLCIITEGDRKPLIVYKIIPTLIRQAIQYVLFVLFFCFPMELIEHFHLSKILNNMSIINLGKGQCLIHPNIDIFESLMVCTMLEDDDDDDESGGHNNNSSSGGSETFQRYQYGKELKKEVNGIGNALMKEHIQFLFSLRHHNKSSTNHIASPSSPNFNKKKPSSVGNNVGKDNEKTDNDLSFHDNYYQSISNEHIQILHKRDEEAKKLSGDVVISSEPTNPDVEVDVEEGGGGALTEVDLVKSSVQLSSSTAI